MSEEIFCPKCHKLAALVLTNNKSTKIVQNGKVLLNMPAGSSGNNITVKCPDGHEVSIEI